MKQELSPAREPSITADAATPKSAAKVRCGDCLYFKGAGRCGWLSSPKGREKHPFEHAPFWVWSDCYSDREQVFANVETLCPTFEEKA